MDKPKFKFGQKWRRADGIVVTVEGVCDDGSFLANCEAYQPNGDTCSEVDGRLCLVEMVEDSPIETDIHAASVAEELAEKAKRPMPEFKVEQVWRQRRGCLRRISSVTPDGVAAGGDSYALDGRWRVDGCDSEFDLVELVKDVPTEPPEADQYSPCAPNCSMCSGEYCARHPKQKCDCDVIDRHNDPVVVPQKPTKPQTADDFLLRAIETLTDRGQEYDRPEGERSMAAVVQAFNVLRPPSPTLTEMDGWLFMALVKMRRQWTAQASGKFHMDSAIDLPAYGALAAEAGQRTWSPDQANTESK